MRLLLTSALLFSAPALAQSTIVSGRRLSG
jgi:hypothetical protein